MQRVGVTDVTIDYSRPSVRDRKIWGEVVPYGKIWRAGADMNTTLTVSTDVKLNGKDVKAGTYGLHMIPGDDEWTLILSNDSHSWGSYFYNEKNDALRVSTKPVAASHTEVLTYDVPEVGKSSMTIHLRWEKLAVPMKIDVNYAATVGEDIKHQLSGLGGFDAGMNVAAAQWMLQNDPTSPLIKSYARRGMNGPPTFASLMLGSKVAASEGNTSRADSLRTKALEIASNNDLNNYGYELLQGGKVNDAIPVFELNAKRHATDPNVWDSLGECYAQAGNKSKAKECYTKVMKLDPPENVKQNSEMWYKKVANSE